MAARAEIFRTELREHIVKLSKYIRRLTRQASPGHNGVQLAGIHIPSIGAQLREPAVRAKNHHFTRDIILLMPALLLFFVSKAFAGPTLTDSDCFECHGDEQASATVLAENRPAVFQKDGEESTEEREKPPIIHRTGLGESVHKGLGCIQCHEDIQALPHEKKLASVNCSVCHKRESEKYLGSVHGVAFSKGDPDVPSCKKCHGDHFILAVSDPRSTVYPTHLIGICISCHADETIEAKHNLPKQELFRAYENSVHGRAIEEKGLVVAAACNDCHGTHEIKPADDPESLVQKKHIPTVCGRCHAGVFADYIESVHGKAANTGIEDAPVCTDCHGEHTIAKVTDPQSKVYSKNVPKTCSACHDDKEIVAEYRLAARRYATYLSSYHGVANKFGVPYVANCASCHGVHNIRPASDPLSTINNQNLPETCGKCHPGASRNFAFGRVHIEATKESSVGVYMVRRFYTWFIGILVTCFVLYVVVETVGKMLRRYASQGK